MKKSMKSGPAAVDEYLDELPGKATLVLKKLRKTIKEAAPKADEMISYGMPGYKYHGMLVYFAAFKNHCSFFPASSTIMKMEEVQPYKTSTGTLQFTIDKPLPTALVKKIVKVRVKENEAKLLAKQLKKSAAKKKSK